MSTGSPLPLAPRPGRLPSTGSGGLSAGGRAGRDGDPGPFVVRLDTDAGPAEISGRPLPQRFHWSALAPWEFALGADLDAPNDPAGPWPVLEAMVALEWDGERGYGLLEVTRPRPA